MTTRYPTVTRRHRMEQGPYISWFLSNRWVRFRISPDRYVDVPEGADLIGHVVSDDHLEELYQYGDQFFRYAGGGRGFYWTQELLVEEEMSSEAYQKIKAQHVEDTFDRRLEEL